MNQKDKLRLLDEQKDDIISSFKHVICSDCLGRFEVVAKPISDRLSNGKKLRFKDVKNIIKCLCSRCVQNVKNKKGEIFQ